MLKFILSTIEKKRGSGELLWRVLIVLKDVIWRCSYKAYHDYRKRRYIKKVYKYYQDKKLSHKKKPLLKRSCAVLKTQYEHKQTLKKVHELNLPPYFGSCSQKNWDSLAALSSILRTTGKDVAILDAGGVLESAILPWLSLYGYKNLRCINLVFKESIKQGDILYEFGDITRTKFENNYFGAITCLSVIEHGVNIDAYFKETSRILKPRGILITSTDYWSEEIDTKNQRAYGVPLKIFTKEKILSAIAIAKKYNLHLIDDIELECKDKVVYWKEFNLRYTFLYFVLRKT